MQTHTITVLGAGAFGTAIAQLLATNGHQVTLWCYEPGVQKSIATTGSNQRYLPGITLHPNITATTSLQEACTSQIIFEAIPIKHLRTVLQHAAPYITAAHQWVILSKGIENNTLLLPTAMIKDVLPQTAAACCAVLSGPSYAKEVAHQQPTIVTVASSDSTYVATIQKLVNNSWFAAELSDDILGVQLCAAYKNVAAIYLGMLEGAGYGDNTKIRALLTCLTEMNYLVQACGGKEEAASGPAGLGDMILTGLGSQSRNQALGMRLGKGESLEHILRTLDGIPEGVNTVTSLQQLAKKNNLTLPICSVVHEIIFDGKSMTDIVATMTVN